MDRPVGLQEVETPRISRQSVLEGSKVVSPTHRPPLRPEYIPRDHFCYRLSQHHGHSAAEKMKLIKNPNNTIGNRTHDLPVFSAVPQPTSSLKKVKVKQFHYRPRQAQRVLRKLRFPDFVTTAQDGGRLSVLRTGRLYPQEMLLVIISVRG